jgi:hypothetical protein
MKLFKRHSEYIPDLYTLARELNIKRTNVAACLILVFQIFDRSFCLLGKVPWIDYFSYALIILCVVFLILSNALRYADMNRNTDIPYVICKLYCLLLLLIMSFYYFSDITHTGIPVNVMVTGSLFLIIPVYINSRILSFFRVYAYNLIICLFCMPD